GIDVAVRLGELPDSTLRAIRVGHVYMAVYGSPDYLARNGTPKAPHDLQHHNTISCTGMTPVPNQWSFEGTKGVGAV
ncbi:LysR substrate-binding domain-containing protein, partial [Enterococcus faecium]